MLLVSYCSFLNEVFPTEAWSSGWLFLAAFFEAWLQGFKRPWGNEFTYTKDMRSRVGCRPCRKKMCEDAEDGLFVIRYCTWGLCEISAPLNGRCLFSKISDSARLLSIGFQSFDIMAASSRWFLGGEPSSWILHLASLPRLPIGAARYAARPQTNQAMSMSLKRRFRSRNGHQWLW